MNKEQLLKLRENHQVEFKKSMDTLPKSFWETYSAFLNTSGGVIILGISENEKAEPVITGVNDPEKIKTELFNQLSNKNKISFSAQANSDVMIQEIEEKKIIWVFVNEAPWRFKPVYVNNDKRKAFYRTADGDRLLTEDEFGIFSRNASLNSDTIALSDDFSFDDLDPSAVTSYKEAVTRRYPDRNYDTMNREKFLLELGFMCRNRRTNKICLTKGLLLFLGKYNSIKEIYPSYHLDYFNRIGNNERWIDRVATDEPNDFEPNLYNFYNIVSEKLRALSVNEFQLDANNVRTESKKYDSAIREAFVNTLAHADYDLGHPSTKIEVHQGWLRFVNPGGMLVDVDVFKQGGTSKPRNEIVMRMFRLLGASERQGMGGPEIFRTAVRNKSRIPEIVTTLERTELKLWHIDMAGSYPELDENERAVFEYIIKNEKDVSMKEIIKKTGYTEYKVKKAISSLLEDKKIEVKGKGPSTRYGLALGTPERLAQLHIRVNDITMATTKK